MKRVAINTRFLLKDKLEGFGWFTFYTAKYLVENNPDIQFYFLFDRPYDQSFVFSENVQPVVLFPQARHPLLFRWWFDFSVTRFLKQNKIDLFISPDGYLSLKTTLPQIAVIHDLNFEHYPEDLKAHHSRYLRKFFPKFARKADAIVTVSNFSMLDIVETYKIDPAKITVAYNGVSDFFNTTDSNQREEEDPYFLFVGSIHPRKNLNRLLQAFDHFKSSTATNHKLLVVGDPYFWTDEMKVVLENMRHRHAVVFKPYSSVKTLKGYYQHAEALLFVSYFEGFGIPVVEAMACGCPVVVGKNTACDEIAGAAALKVDPFSIAEISDAMRAIATDKELRQTLIEKGAERAKNFTWDQTGGIMNDVMNKFIGRELLPSQNTIEL
jgi:glycosyltransferase involved in cell wall biosynthesis